MDCMRKTPIDDSLPTTVAIILLMYHLLIFRFYLVMTTPPYLNERSIFAYTPSSYNPSATKIAAKTGRNNNQDDDKKYANITDCPEEIHCTLPDGITVENHPISAGETNWGLYATKNFPKHSVIYIREHRGYIHDKCVDYNLIIDPAGISIPLNTDRHMHRCAEGVCTLITYGSLTNHSCDPNCYSDRTFPGLKEDQETAIIALRDIYPGDEITIDYDLAAYDMEGLIQTCYCQMPSCRGSCIGFKFLSETEKEKLLPYAKLNVQVAYWLDKQEEK